MILVIHKSITFGVNLSTIYIAFKYFVCWELGVVGWVLGVGCGELD